MAIANKTLNKLYEKQTYLELNQPLGYQFILWIIEKQIKAYEKIKDYNESVNNTEQHRTKI